jgi:protein SCO1/2
MKIKTLFLLALVALALGACAGYQFHGVPYEPPQAAPPITGLDQNGAPFSLDALQGNVVLVFFGYSSCPDICPTTLAEMRQLRSLIKDKADRVKVVYVTVDPERDTPERLKEYLAAFDPTFTGVFNNSIDLEPIKQAYGVVAEKVYYDAKDTAAGYSVDHTARTYLIGPRGRLVTSYPYQSPIENIQKDVEYLLSEVK